MKSFSFRVKRIRTQMGITLRDGGETQLKVDYRTMNKIDPYPKCGKEEEFKITYTKAKKGKFLVTDSSGGGGTFLFVMSRKTNSKADNYIGFTFMNCLAPEDLDWKVGTNFNRKVKVVPKRKINK